MVGEQVDKEISEREPRNRHAHVWTFNLLQVFKCDSVEKEQTSQQIIIQIYTCVCVYIYIYIYIYTHTHILTHPTEPASLYYQNQSKKLQEKRNQYLS